jgi:hypothetical protein
MRNDITCNFNGENERWEVGFGLSPVSAANLLAREFPDVSRWMAWNMRPDPAEIALRAMLGEGVSNQGKFGKWNWERVPCSYGNVGFWSGRTKRLDLGSSWVGMVRITGAKGENFLMFSYIRADLSIGSEYLVSTGDIRLLRRFADDAMKYLRPRKKPNKIIVNVVGHQPDIVLKADEVENVYLPDDLHRDILAQVDGFFGGKEAYKELDIPYKRGFLFTGMPGTGKTMLIRQLIRHVYRKHRVETSYLAVTRKTDADDLRMLFGCASAKKPAMLILEDIESLCQETTLTRSEVLDELDGIKQRSGMLLIATANDPSRIDPALVHRPSRFDRVWTFPVPDLALRTRYIADHFKGIDSAFVHYVAEETEDWTLAYVKELRTTAAILAVRDGLKALDASHVKTALQLLQEQFRAGKNGHADGHKSNRKVGFGFGGRRENQAPAAGIGVQV